MSGYRLDERERKDAPRPSAEPAPELRLEIDPDQPPEPGLGRVAWLIAAAVWTFVSLVLVGMTLESEALAVLSVFAFPIIHLFLIGRRLANAGHNPWLALLTVIPLANIWVAFICLFAPPGYTRTKRLDRPGAVALLVILVIAFLLLVPVLW